MGHVIKDVKLFHATKTNLKTGYILFIYLFCFVFLLVVGNVVIMTIESAKKAALFFFATSKTSSEEKMSFIHLHEP